MGVVWAATEAADGRPAALKFLKERGLEHERRRRFEREARATVAVGHPNVVPVREVLEDEDGALALVMELLAGESMATRLERVGALPAAEVAAIGLEVCHAIAAAHAVGIVHRDLKHDNIFLTDDGGVKVLDFGIAKIAPNVDAASGASFTSLTSTGAVLGTPLFMSPEQAFGERSIDHRTDVWSLGLVLYEALSGVLPTRAENVGQVLKIIVTGPIAPLGDVAPSVPAALAELVDRMLSRDREARPTLAEIAAVLAPTAHHPGALEQTLQDRGGWPAPDAGARGTGVLSATALDGVSPGDRFEHLDPPETRYTEGRGGVSIAYQVFGRGPVDMVVAPGIVSHLEAFWEEPEGVRFLSLLGSFARVVMFDKRGSGLSDRLPDDAPPTIEERVADVCAVMDAAHIEAAVVLGISEGGPMMASFAATHPERTVALVLYGTAARFKSGSNLEAFIETVRTTWGKGIVSQLFAPEVGADPRLLRWFARIERLSATPRAAAALAEMLRAIDVRATLPKIAVPTLILHRADDGLVSVGAARALAAEIPGATLIEYPTGSGPNHLMLGDYDTLLRDVRALLETCILARPAPAPGSGDT